MGHQAVAEQCRAIDEWRAEIGKAKQEPKPESTAALEGKIEALCRERMEQAYRDISGALIACIFAKWASIQAETFCPEMELTVFACGGYYRMRHARQACWMQKSPIQAVKTATSPSCSAHTKILESANTCRQA